MIGKMRSSAVNAAVALALAGLVTSGPTQAVAAQDDGLQTLADTIASLEDPVPAPSAAEKAIRAAEPDYELIGGGEASYYGHELAGNRTASGERFNPQALTAAHRTLPLGTKLRVTNRANGRSVIVRINDRGPFVGRRIIDVSLAAAREIRMVGSGKAQVTLEILRIA